MRDFNRNKKFCPTLLNSKNQLLFIQLDDLNLETAEEVVGVAEAETAAAASLELVEEEAEEDKEGSPPPPLPTVASDVAAELRLSAKSTEEGDGKGNGGVGDDAGGRQTSANDDSGKLQLPYL